MVDVAIDKVFHDVEPLVGVSKVIGKGAAHVFSSPQNSVWFLGLIAVAKLLSPSHNTESISLYKDYTKYLAGVEVEDSPLKNDFKGFISNRFGRLGELSAAVFKHIHHIRQFFEEQVEENANKLVLAVYNFIRSDWFLTCCKVAKCFYDEITIPIKKLIGMDEFKETKSDQRSWTGIKKEFETIINNLTNMAVQSNTTDGVNCLKSKAASSIKEALQRQLSAVSFFNGDDSDTEINAPLTNLGCEGNFSSLGNDCKRAGGSVKLKTISDMSVISHNKLYTKDRWKLLSETERRKKFRWARNSKQAKEIKRMEKEFYDKVQAVSDLAIEAKKKKKQDKHIKTMKILEKCKAHGGPLTLSDINVLDTLSDEEVILEAKYLKKTAAPNLRLKRKQGNKFVNFTTDEIRQQIRDFIQPESAVEEDLDQLLKNVMPRIQELNAGVIAERSHTITLEEAQEGKKTKSDTKKKTKKATGKRQVQKGVCETEDDQLEEDLEVTIELHQTENDQIEQDSEVKVNSKVGMLGIWEGKLGEKEVGMIVDDDTLQMFQRKRQGFVPVELMQTTEDWTLIEEISSYSYELKNKTVYLVF